MPYSHASLPLSVLLEIHGQQRAFQHRLERLETKVFGEIYSEDEKTSKIRRVTAWGNLGFTGLRGFIWLMAGSGAATKLGIIEWVLPWLRWLGLL